MKRLVFCFDGTWNRLDAAYPTNVVLTAESVLPLAPDGTAQLIFYDEGVGTDKNETVRGGMFGEGLVKNLADAYRFLIFNYSPGDQIYIFGFSRGAYTARSFAGLINVCGIILRKYASTVNVAIEQYKRRDDSPDYLEEMLTYRKDHSPYVVSSDEEEAWRYRITKQSGLPRLEVHYVGVWDTVGALGIPERYSWLSWINKKHRFHDFSLSKFVKCARHAVAIDERRSDFAPTLWDNIDELNVARGKRSDDPDAPYQQVWFPGVHSSVGGGGERRGLSDGALEWVLDGARAEGLVLDSDRYSRVFEHQPDYREFLENSADPGMMYSLMKNISPADRSPGPTSLTQVATSAKRRWLERAEILKDGVQYRPGALARIAPLLDALDPAEFGLGRARDDAGQFELYEVQPGDNLSRIAQAKYGKADWQRIFRANLHQIDNPHRIYPGQLLRIPRP